jgi:hypothetical protein
MLKEGKKLEGVVDHVEYKSIARIQIKKII